MSHQLAEKSDDLARLELAWNFRASNRQPSIVYVCGGSRTSANGVMGRGRLGTGGAGGLQTTWVTHVLVEGTLLAI